MRKCDEQTDSKRNSALRTCVSACMSACDSACVRECICELLRQMEKVFESVASVKESWYLPIVGSIKVLLRERKTVKVKNIERYWSH